MTVGHRHRVGTLGLPMASLLLLLTLPYGSAHGGGTPVAYKEADLTLAPVGQAQALFHQFGFQMSPGDILHMQYVVTNPRNQTVDFSVHRHNATGYLEILNVTQASLQLDRSVPDSGLYMPQWLNLIAQNLTLHYTMYFVRGPSLMDLVEEILAMGVPAGLLGLFAFTHFRNKRRGRQGSGGGPKEGRPEAGDKAVLKGPP